MKELQKVFSKEMKEYSEIRLESVKAQARHDNFAITAKNVPERLDINLDTVITKEAEFKKEYASRVFDYLSKTKPDLIRRRDGSILKWEEAFGDNFQNLPAELWASLVALVEEKGGQYRISE